MERSSFVSFLMVVLLAGLINAYSVDKGDMHEMKEFGVATDADHQTLPDATEDEDNTHSASRHGPADNSFPPSHYGRHPIRPSKHTDIANSHSEEKAIKLPVDKMNKFLEQLKNIYNNVASHLLSSFGEDSNELKPLESDQTQQFPPEDTEGTPPTEEIEPMPTPDPQEGQNNNPPGEDLQHPPLYLILVNVLASGAIPSERCRNDNDDAPPVEWKPLGHDHGRNLFAAVNTPGALAHHPLTSHVFSKNIPFPQRVSIPTHFSTEYHQLHNYYPANHRIAFSPTPPLFLPSIPHPLHLF